MNTNAIQGSWRAAKRRIAVFWSTEHTAPYEIEVPPIYVSAEKVAVNNLLRPASPLARLAARLVAATKPGMSKKEIKQQKEALSTWEDEGGTAAASKPKMSDTAKQ